MARLAPRAQTEIERLIQLLQRLQTDPEQRFHMSSDYAASSGVGDIEVSVAGAEDPDNLWLGGTFAPGAKVPPATG